MEEFPINKTETNSENIETPASINDAEIGAKANDTVLAENSESNTSSTSSDRPRDEKKWLQENHPELYKEMRDNGVPFEPEEFKKEGYDFIQRKDGEYQVAYPTQKYKNWLDAPKTLRSPNRPLKHHWMENQLTREERNSFDNTLEALGVDDKYAYYNGLRQKIETKVKKYQDFLESPKFQERLLSPNNIVASYSRVYESSIDSNRIPFSAENIQKEALAINRPEALMNNYWPEDKIAIKMAEPLFEEAIKKENSVTGEPLGQSIEAYMASPEAEEARAKIIVSAINNRSFLEGTNLDEFKEQMPKILGQCDINNHPRLVQSIIGKSPWLEMAPEKLKLIDEYLGISDKVAEATIYETDYPIKATPYSNYNWDFNIHFEQSRGSFFDAKKVMDLSIKKKCLEKIGERIANEDRGDERFASALAEDKKTAKVDFEENSYLYDLKDKLVDIKPIKLKEYFNDKYSPGVARFAAEWIRKNEHLEIGAEEVKTIAKEKILLNLEHGNILRQDVERFGIDLSSSEVFDKCFSGFVERIQRKGGVKSDEAKWYYDKVFSQDPEKFNSMIINMRKDPDCPASLKGAFTRFANVNEEYKKYSFQEELNKRAKAPNRAAAYQKHIFKDASDVEIEAIIKQRRSELSQEIKEAGAEEVETFGHRSDAPEKHNDGNRYYNTAPKDFGIRKIEMLKTWKEHIENTYPGTSPKYFIDSFAINDEDRIRLNDDLSYVGFSFEYEGKQCVIAESFSLDASMYLFRGNLDDDFKDMFDVTKKRSATDPRVVKVNHLSKEAMDESIDLTYQKAFLYLRTGDKSIVNYNAFGENGRNEWEEYQQMEFPAWPMNVDSQEISAEELARYRKWQENPYFGDRYAS